MTVAQVISEAARELSLETVRAELELFVWQRAHNGWAYQVKRNGINIPDGIGFGFKSKRQAEAFGAETMNDIAHELA